MTAVHADARLHHLAFESAAPKRLAEFYADVMDMDLEQISAERWRCEGPGRRLLTLPGQNKCLAFVGMACRDRDGLAALKARAESERIEIVPSPSPYFADDAFAVRDPIGTLICFGLAAADPPSRQGIPGRTQHFGLSAQDPQALVSFYHGKLGFALMDRVLDDAGMLTAAFATSNHEHHTIACFKSSRNGLDHHCYEAGEWNFIRDWCDRFAAREIPLKWGPGRHGPGNNLFAFVEDPDGNYVEVSAELEVVFDRPMKDWPKATRTLNLWGSAITRT